MYHILYWGGHWFKKVEQQVDQALFFFILILPSVLCCWVLLFILCYIILMLSIIPWKAPLWNFYVAIAAILTELPSLMRYRKGKPWATRVIRAIIRLLLVLLVSLPVMQGVQFSHKIGILFCFCQRFCWWALCMQ